MMAYMAPPEGLKDQHAGLREAFCELASLVEQTRDPAKASEYIKQLTAWKNKLTRLKPATKPKRQ